MVQKNIRKKIKDFARELKKEGIVFTALILFGSRATGRTREFSDIDIAVVSPKFGKDRYREGAKLFEIASRVDPLIEPVPVSQRSYEQDTWSPLIHEIRQNGIEVKAA